MSTKYIVNNISGQTINDEPILRPYKVYTALLTQSGGSNSVQINSGELIVGVTYIIDQSDIGTDFRNVGGPLITYVDEFLSTYFVATGTTPNSWLPSTFLSYNTGAPVVTVLENTIGNIWFTYEGVGNYFTNSTGFFLINKYFAPQASNGYDADVNNSGGGDPYNWYRINDNQISILINGDNRLNNSPIEIRVY
jgi:hypothetical protein